MRKKNILKCDRFFIGQNVPQHHQSSGATMPWSKPQWHQTIMGTKWKARFKTHTQRFRPRPAVVNKMFTKSPWKKYKKGTYKP